MPDIVTHATLAKDVYNHLADEQLKKIIDKHRYIYYLGAQGPDVFYFFNLFYKLKIKGFNHIGNILHDYHVDEFLSFSFRYLKDHYDEALHVYLLGFICHHALDRNCHPYVYHVTGIYKTKEPETIKYRGNHLRLEKAIDSIYIKENWGAIPHKFNLYKNLFRYKINEKVFVPYFDYIIDQIYELKQAGRVFMNSSRNFKLATKLYFDPYGFKKRLARFIDRFFNKKGKIVFETLSYYHNINKDIDYLNLNHKEWVHPVHKDETSTKSFLELYQISISHAFEEMNLANDYLLNRMERLHVKNLSYSTGKPWEEGRDMQHFNSIF